MSSSEKGPIISVIVPVYNVEKYLDKCICSIINQTMQELEIILVDDGSQDKSGKICDKYKEIDPRIKVIHKKNEGLSAARNTGIEIAEGAFLGFVDSDDYIDEDMYELLYRNIIRENADISMCALYHCYEGKEPKANANVEYMVLNQRDAIRTVMEAEKATVSAINKLYKKSLFDEVKYPVGKLTEDAFVIIELLLRTNVVVLETVSKYYYVHRTNSITTSMFKEKDLNVIEAYQKNMSLIKKSYPELMDVAIMRCMWAHFYVLDKIMLTEKIDDATYLIEKRIVHYLRKNFQIIIRDTHFHKSRKIAMLALMLNTKLYKLCVLISKKKYVE